MWFCFAHKGKGGQQGAAAVLLGICTSKQEPGSQPGTILRTQLALKILSGLTVLLLKPLEFFYKMIKVRALTYFLNLQAK